MSVSPEIWQKIVASLTPGERSGMEAFAGRYGDLKTQRVTATVCTICGRLEWLCTSAPGAANPGLDLEQRDQFGPACPVCLEVSQRHPELFRWVVNTSMMQARVVRAAL